MLVFESTLKNTDSFMTSMLELKKLGVVEGQKSMSGMALPRRIRVSANGCQIIISATPAELFQEPLSMGSTLKSFNVRLMRTTL